MKPYLKPEIYILYIYFPNHEFGATLKFSNIDLKKSWAGWNIYLRFQFMASFLGICSSSFRGGRPDDSSTFSMKYS